MKKRAWYWWLGLGFLVVALVWIGLILAPHGALSVVLGDAPFYLTVYTIKLFGLPFFAVLGVGVWLMAKGRVEE